MSPKRSRTDPTPGGAEALDELTADHAELLSVIGAELSESSDVIDSLSRNAEAANRSSSETVDRAETAQSSARDAHDDVTGAREAAVAAHDRLEALQETLDEIGEITGILDGIAEQTNMLALNASIEAARVGEDGDGFAVVADEVKSLAEEASRQATEIDAVVEEVEAEADATIDRIRAVDGRTDAAADSITETVDDLDEIAASAVETSESVDGVADTTQTFADDVDDIASDFIDAITQANELDERIDG